MTKVQLLIIGFITILLGGGIILFLSIRSAKKEANILPNTVSYEDAEKLERQRYANEKMIEKEVTVSGGKKVIIRSPEGLGDIPPEFIEKFLPTIIP